jgi:hypothetical protein
MGSNVHDFSCRWCDSRRINASYHIPRRRIVAVEVSGPKKLPICSRCYQIRRDNPLMDFERVEPYTPIEKATAGRGGE